MIFIIGGKNNDLKSNFLNDMHALNLTNMNWI